MPVYHSLTATTPDDPNYEIRPSHWNNAHAVSLTAASEIIGAFSNDAAYNVSFTTIAGSKVVASANVTAAPSPVNVTGANGSSVNAQTIAFSNSNGLSLGVSTAANGATVTGSYTVPTQTAFVFSNSNGVTFGTNGSTVTASVATNYQSQGAYLTTAAQSNQVVNSVNGSTGQISFATGSSLSSSQNGSTITWGLASNITTALQSAGAYLTTARASNDAVGLNTAQSNVTWTVNSAGLSVDARGYAGTGTSVTGGAAVTLNSNGLAFNGASLAGTSSGFTGANISGSMTVNTAGVALSMSVAAGGGGGFTGGVSTGGNTSGQTGTQTGQLVFAGGNNITLSVATAAGGNQTITISGANAGGAQTGISGIQVSDTTYSSGTVTFQNANGISFGSSGANGISASYTVPSTAGLISAVKVSAGTTSNNLSALTFSNSNGITFGLNASTLTASHNGITQQSTQPVAVSANNGSYAFSTLSFSNANGVSFGTSAGSAITASVNTSYRASNDAIGLNTAQSNVTWTVNSAGLSLDARGYAGTGTSATNASVTLNSNGLAISVAAAGGAATETAYFAGNTTVSSSGTQPLSSLQFKGYGIASVGYSNGSYLISTPDPVTITEMSVGISGGNTSGNTGTVAGGQVVFAGGNNITLSGSTNGSSMTITVSAGAGGGGVTPVVSAANGSYSFTTLSFSNANGMSFGTSAGSAVTGSYTVPSVTQYFSATNTTFNGANISGSMTLNTNGLQLSMSVAAPGAAAENNNHNLLGANTAGNTTASGSTIGLSGINLTLSGTNGSVINISAPATSSLVGASGLTVSTAGSTISVGQVLVSYFDNVGGFWANSTTMTMRQSTSAMIPMMLPEPISFGFIRMPITASQPASTTAATTGNSQFSYGTTRTHNFVLYSRGTGANSQSLQSVASTSFTDQQSVNVSANANSTQFSYTNRATYYSEGGTFSTNMDYSSSAASLNFHTSGMTGYSGVKMVGFPWATSLSAGAYWLAYGMSTSTASQFTNAGSVYGLGWSNYGASQPNLAFGTLGAATNSSVMHFYGMGSFTTNVQTTASLGFSAISSSSAHARPIIILGNIA